MTLASDARAIARAGIRSVEPACAIPRFVRVRRDALWVGGRAVRSTPGEPIDVVAFGKASVGMAREIGRLLRGRVRGVVVRTEPGRAAPPPYADLVGGHPVPDRNSRAAARAVVRFVGDRRPGPILFLVSGGGSAMLEEPADGLTLRDLVETNRVLLGNSVPIGTMNAIRRHLSGIKGGWLADRVRGRTAITLAISDVTGDGPADIASGPTAPDPSTFRDAARLARAGGFWSELPPRVRRHLEEGVNGRRPETPKPGSETFRGHRYLVIASNRDAVRSAAREAVRRGYRTHAVAGRVVGESRSAGERMGAELGRLARRPPGARPIAIVSGGETTVSLGRGAPRGGRNQELVLAAAPVLDGLGSALLLSAGTDGVDGPTDAAGGWVDGSTVSRARRRGVDLMAALAAHESYDALSRLGLLWRTGPTGTNVADLHVGLVGRARVR